MHSSVLKMDVPQKCVTILSIEIVLPLYLRLIPWKTWSSKQVSSTTATKSFREKNSQVVTKSQRVVTFPRFRKFYQNRDKKTRIILIIDLTWYLRSFGSSTRLAPWGPIRNWCIPNAKLQFPAVKVLDLTKVWDIHFEYATSMHTAIRNTFQRIFSYLVRSCY